MGKIFCMCIHTCIYAYIQQTGPSRPTEFKSTLRLHTLTCIHTYTHAYMHTCSKRALLQLLASDGVQVDSKITVFQPGDADMLKNRFPQRSTILALKNGISTTLRAAVCMHVCLFVCMYVCMYVLLHVCT
jgi:hypothetical protein